MKSADELAGAIWMIDQAKGKPTVQLLDQIRGIVKNAVDALLEPDPLKQRIAFILLSIKQSTSVRETKVYNRETGKYDKIRKIVSIVDAHLYEWAINEIHRLAA